MAEVPPNKIHVRHINSVFTYTTETHRTIARYKAHVVVCGNSIYLKVDQGLVFGRFVNVVE